MSYETIERSLKTAPVGVKANCNWFKEHSGELENTPRGWGKRPPKMNHTGKVSKFASNYNIAQRIA